ncbi:hypothetical protein EG329_004057 [Mollisiaceae sp. DMI_Dod_QoI]|nr:hypothetical protein EG329_004057 [Helotiales sp. DMI_Dod_QoI]
MTETFGKRPPRSETTKLVPFTDFTPPTQCIIDLYYAVPKKERRRTTLASAMEFNINPGWLLCQRSSPEFNECLQYKMKSIMTTKLQTHAAERKGKGSMRSRIFRLSSRTSHHTFVEMMALMWNALNHRITVEVQVQHHRKWKSQGAEKFTKLFNECLHLRPDVMLKAMPPNCGIVVDPQTDNESVVCWVIAPPYMDKSGEAFPPNNASQKLYERREKAIAKMKELEAARSEAKLNEAFPPLEDVWKERKRKMDLRQKYEERLYRNLPLTS